MKPKDLLIARRRIVAERVFVVFHFFPQAYPLVFEITGVIGFGLYVTNYTLLTIHKLHSHDALYFCINLVAAVLVLVSLSASFNLASAMIQTFWVVISSAAILIRLRHRWRPTTLK